MNLIISLLGLFAEENCVSTALFGEVCDACNGGGINFVLMYAIEAMIFGIGILAVIGLSVFGIQYLTAGSNSAQTAKAKGRLRNMIIGVITYIVLIVGLQFLMPGGIKGLVVTTADSCPEKRETDIDVIEPKDPEDDLGGGGGPSGGPSGGDLGGGEVEPVAKSDRLEVHFFSYGGRYDDVIIIRSKGGVILIDGGVRGRAKPIAEYIKGIGETKIDYMIGSHLDANHSEVQGELYLNRSELGISIGTALYPIDPTNCNPIWCEADARNMLTNAINKGMNAVIPKPATTKITLGSMEMFFIGTREEDFSPCPNYKPGKDECANSTSIINYLRYGNTSFLFTGDLSGLGAQGSTAWTHIKEDAAKAGITSLKVDVVKWPHHGNDNTDAAFWRETNPAYIAVPNNGAPAFPKPAGLSSQRSGAPGASVIKLSNYNYFTFVSDGKTVTVEYNKDPSYWANYWK